MDELIVRLFQVAPLCAALLILTVFSWLALRLIRANLSKTELRPVNYLESFQKLYEEGKLTAEEFRTIKRLVSLQITRSPGEAKPDYSLLNKSPPSQSTDRPTGNIPKK